MPRQSEILRKWLPIVLIAAGAFISGCDRNGTPANSSVPVQQPPTEDIQPESEPERTLATQESPLSEATEETPVSEDEGEPVPEGERWPRSAIPVALEAAKPLIEPKIENVENADYRRIVAVNAPYNVDGFPTAAVGGRVLTADISDKTQPRNDLHVIVLLKDGKMEPVYIRFDADVLLGDQSIWEKAHRRPDDRTTGKD